MLFIPCLLQHLHRRKPLRRPAVRALFTAPWLDDALLHIGKMIDVVLDDLERTVQLVLRDAEQSDIGSVLLLGRPGNDKRQMIPFYSLVDSSLEIISPCLLYTSRCV